LGQIEDDEMARVFNMGLGLVLVVSPFHADKVRRLLCREGMDTWAIGRIAG
jgi:phosphoribosylformylglycinamidine cyclo-ligase